MSDFPALLEAMTGDEAFSFLVRGTLRVDWGSVPAAVPLVDGGSVTFDPKRRCATIGHVGGGTTVIDLGRHDRMRSRDAIFSPGLLREDGPELVVSENPRLPGTGEVALRDPLSPRIKRATEISGVGLRSTYRLVDTSGRLQIVGFGEADHVTGFGTFLMDGGLSYAHLRTLSGLGCFYDAPRAAFLKACTEGVIERARFEGFAAVSSRIGVIGVVFDCGAPGDYLALSTYGGPNGGTVGIVVDLRRPPVRNGAIVDPDGT